MEKRNDNIDRYFRDRLGKLEQQPPEANWNAIAERLGHKKKKGMAVLIFRIAAGMAILISTGIGYYLVTKQANQSTPSLFSGNKESVTNKVVPEPNKINKNLASVSENNTTVQANPESAKPSVEATKTYDNSSIFNSVAPATLLDPDLHVINGGTTGNLQSDLPVAITGSRQQYQIPARTPSSLAYVHIPPTTSITAEEAIALLLAESEGAVENEEQKPDRWVMGGEIAPLYSYRKIASENSQVDMISDLNDSESGLLAYAGGLRIAFSAGKRLSVQSGIYYSRYGQEKNKIESYDYSYNEFAAGENSRERYISITNSTGIISSKNPGTAGYDKVVSSNVGANSSLTNFNGFMQMDKSVAVPSENLDVKLTQVFDYLELPLLVKYKVIDRKFDFSFTGGLVTNFLVGNVVNIKQDGETSRFGETKGIDKVNYLGSFGLGFEYPISSGFAFTIEPRFRYYINSIDNSSQINVHPYSFGFFAGLSYVF